MNFTLLKDTGNKLIFKSDDSIWTIWTYGPDEKNPWYIIKDNVELNGEWETFNKAIDYIELKIG